MEIVEFNGYRCVERPISDWQRYTCKHLAGYVSAPGGGKPSSVIKVLQDGSRSSEIFLFVKGPLPSVQELEQSPIKGNSEVITCNSCWINVYVANDI